jgi:hypothetical protein
LRVAQDGNNELDNLHLLYGDDTVYILIDIASSNTLKADACPMYVYKRGSPHGEVQQRIVAMLKAKHLPVVEVADVGRVLAFLLKNKYADIVATDDPSAHNWGVGPVLRKFSRTFVEKPETTQFYPQFLPCGRGGDGSELSADDLELIKHALEPSTTKRKGNMIMRRGKNAKKFIRETAGQPKIDG